MKTHSKTRDGLHLRIKSQIAIKCDEYVMFYKVFKLWILFQYQSFWRKTGHVIL